MSWKPGEFVPTAAANRLRTLATEVAGHNCVVGVTAYHSYGKSFLARGIHDSSKSLGIENRVALVDFWAEEETNAALRRIAVEVGWHQDEVRNWGASHLFDCIVAYIHRRKVDLMLVDNADLLCPEMLLLIGQLSSTFPRRPGLARLPDELTLPIEEGMGSRCNLGVILLGKGFDADQVEALRDSCDWRGKEELPPLGFEEMAQILSHWDNRFRPIIEKAIHKPNSEEFAILQLLYAVTEGSFGRFERILRRFSFAPGAPILPIGIATVLEAYRKSQLVPARTPAPETIKL